MLVINLNKKSLNELGNLWYLVWQEIVFFIVQFLCWFGLPVSNLTSSLVQFYNITVHFVCFKQYIVGVKGKLFWFTVKLFDPSKFSYIINMILQDPNI